MVAKTNSLTGQRHANWCYWYTQQQLNMRFYLCQTVFPIKNLQEETIETSVMLQYNSRKDMHIACIVVSL